MAAGKEAVNEEEAGLERFAPAARQPAARRHLRFLQELRGGDTGEDREERSLSVTRWPWVTTSCTVRANGAVALAGALSPNKVSAVLHEGKATAQMAGQHRRKSAGRMIKVFNIIVRFNL